jgi:hypothetical protein
MDLSVGGPSGRTSSYPEDMPADDLPAYWHKFWELYADSFIAPLKPNDSLGNFVRNPSITGPYAEAWIRAMARNMLPQFRISTGAVLRPSDLERNLKSVAQCDLIVWNPSELPAIFEQGDFALVPTHSVHAIIEIKRSCSSFRALANQLEVRRKLLQPKSRRNLLGVIVNHSGPVFPGESKPNWLADARWNRDFPIVALLSNHATPNTSDIMAFIYFLAQIAGHNEQIS